MVADWPEGVNVLDFEGAILLEIALLELLSRVKKATEILHMAHTFHVQS